jgi:A/G-specific adenine glycosylase
VVEKQHEVIFREALSHWHLTQNARTMPWKGIGDPYRIWLSEVILQQTRVEQGLSYYNRFLEHFPTIHQLAEAADESVFKLWEGLGYYSRCRNLLVTARHISKELEGQFPQTEKGLLSLKGVGKYTAAAIGSFAFGLPLAVVDGNVYRVLSRHFGLDTPIDTPDGRNRFAALAANLLDRYNPARHNQAIMDLGAVVCKPKNPLCHACPFESSCIANKNSLQDRLPVKSQKVKVRSRFMYYLIVEHHGDRLVRKREGKDIWQNLYEFVLRETDEPAAEEELKQATFWGLSFTISRGSSPLLSEEFTHMLTHQRIKARFLHLRTNQKINIPGYTWMGESTVSKLPFPRLINRYLDTK